MLKESKKVDFAHRHYEQIKIDDDSNSDSSDNRIMLDIILEDKRWKEELGEDLKEVYLNNILDSIIKEIKISPYINNLDLCIVLASDVLVKDLNKKYRDKDNSTNVLSFPTETLDYKNLQSIEELQDESLGDVVFSFDVVKKESIDQSKKFIDHFTHLFIHGILHIFGFDHMKDDEANDMETVEIKILKEFSIASPY